MESNIKKEMNETEELIKEIKKKVYVNDEILNEIVPLLVSIKNNSYVGKRPSKGILFYGPPGTGKTLLMNTLIENLSLSKKLIIRGPEIISEYYGKSESRLRQIFAIAKELASKENLAIIYIDELDSIAPRRDMVRGELESRLVGQLLTLMDGLESEEKNQDGHVIVIGSTNRLEALDPALRRPGRFDLEIEFFPPNEKERREILKILLKNEIKEKIGTPILENEKDLDEIAKLTNGFTGADLLYLLNKTLLKITKQNKKDITKEDLLSVIDKINPSALREFHTENPIDYTKDIKKENNDDLIKKIETISDEFIRNPIFKTVLLCKSNSIEPNKIASTIAFEVNARLSNCPYITISGNWFKSKWYGETEQSIRNFFERIKRFQPSIVYLKHLDAVGINDEHLNGAIIELLDNLEYLKDNNFKILFIASISKDNIDKINKDLKDYFTLEFCEFSI
jgi:transitional endoplasmic reticulum ATPase